MKFPYIEFRGLAEERIFRPMIPVIFQANKKTFHSYALVDSGSDYTILPLDVAKTFDFYLHDQPQYYIEAAGGSSMKVYRSPIQLTHVIKKDGFREIKWSSHVYFGLGAATTLIGQKGFLDQFEFRLNGPKKEIEIIKAC